MVEEENAENEEQESAARIVERLSLDADDTDSAHVSEKCQSDGISRYPVEMAMDMYAPKTAEEERVIWETMPRPDAKKLLVLHNMQFAAQMARRYSARGADFEDLRQIALLGLVKAAENYDPEKAPVKDDGTRQPFISYAGKVIRTLLSRECSPDSTVAATKTNLKTFLLPAMDDGGDDRTIDVLLHNATMSKWRSDPDEKEYIDGMMSGLRQLMKSDCTDTFTQEVQDRILRWVKKLADGKTVIELATEEGCSKQYIANTLSRFKAFLLRKALSRSSDLGDVDWLLQKSEYINAAKSMRREMGLAVYHYLFNDFSEGYESSVQSKLNSRLKEKRESRRAPSLFNASRFIPSRSFKGELAPMVSTPERGNFYSSSSRKTFAAPNRQESSRCPSTGR